SLRTIPEAARARLAQRRGQVGELAQQLAGVARVDDLLDTETLGGAERRAHLVEPRLDRGEMSGRIGRRGELGLVGGLDAAFERQRAPVARRPGVAEVVLLPVLVRRAGDAERLAQQDRAPWRLALVDRGQRPRAVPDGGGLLAG